MNADAASMRLVKNVQPLFDSWTVTVEVTELVPALNLNAYLQQQQKKKKKCDHEIKMVKIKMHLNKIIKIYIYFRYIYSTT